MCGKKTTHFNGWMNCVKTSSARAEIGTICARIGREKVLDDANLKDFSVPYNQIINFSTKKDTARLEKDSE